MKTIKATVYDVDGKLTTTKPEGSAKVVYAKGAVVSDETHNSIEVEPKDSEPSALASDIEVLAPPHNFTQSIVESKEEHQERVAQEKKDAAKAPKEPPAEATNPSTEAK